ncbi:MAG: BMP family ABC transporter substrate-binding protein [Bacillota bacterium]|nr:BMP family ABC transporter substrate-binding protein [Bacillota bacterium]
MRKPLAIVLVLAMVLSFAACSGKKAQTSSSADTNTASGSAQGTQPAGKVTLDNIKIGFVHISDPSDKGYTYNHDLGTKKMQKNLNLRDDQIVNKYNIKEDDSCESALRELAEQGCNIIFATSFGFEDYVLAVAAEYPNIQFCHATGFQAASSGLKNVHNYFGKIYQARYLSGIAAGLKTKTNKLGYVSAQPFAECISGFDSFYLGALSVNPKVTMDVIYTNSWNNPTAESQAAQALIDRGCDVLGQHCDSTATQTTAESKGIWGVGYNSDMIAAAPKAVLTSAVWDWSVYLTYAVKSVVNGETIPADWSQGLAEGVVDVSALNEATVAGGTADAIKKARDKILGGWDVFTGPLYDNNGTEVVKSGETYEDPGSAPKFDKVLKGITVVSQ